MLQANNDIGEEAVYAILEQKKNFLSSPVDDDEKQVLQEYVDKITLKSSNEIYVFR